jgi:small subunit ribosomal protein S1
MMEMLELLDAAESSSSLERGDVVEGRIALINEHEILIDVGAKTEGILSAREFGDLSPDQRERLAIGETVECMVVNPSDREGNLILSLSQARLGQDWDEAEKFFESGDTIEQIVTGHNKGGLIVHIGDVRGFIPASQIDRRHAIDRSQIDGSSDSPLARFVGKAINVKVIEIDRRKNRLILSEQAAMRERRRQRKAHLLDELGEGDVVDGKVTSLAEFGAFVDIGGADGLVHLSELSWQRVNHPSEVVQLGQTVTVKVISIDRERKRIGLSIKQLEDEPWANLEDRYQIGSIVNGEITRIADFGAFALLDGEVEGLIHVSELSDQELPPEQVVQPGQKLDLRVIRIDADKRRLGLSLKRAAADYDDLALDTSEAAALVDEPPPAAPALEAEESVATEALPAVSPADGDGAMVAAETGESDPGPELAAAAAAASED